MDRPLLIALAPLLLAAIAACGAMPAAPGGASGASGYAHSGPTCPVVSDPPDPACADRPHAGAFVVETRDGRRVADVVSGDDGRFSVALAPGDYRIRLRGDGALPSLAPVDFRVGADAWTTLDLALDSGIR